MTPLPSTRSGAVFFCLFSSLLIFVQVSDEDGYGDAIFGVMVGVSVLVFLIALAQVVNDTSAQVPKKKTGEEGKAYLVDGAVAEVVREETSAAPASGR